MMLLCFSIDNWINTVGILLAILTFIIERYYTSKLNKKLTKENWYLTIIVQPKLEEINKYYNDLIQKIVATIEDLKVKSTTQNHNDYIIDKAIAQDKLKEHRNEFFDDFVTLIQSFDKALASKIQNTLLELDDYCTKVVDSENAKDFSRHVLENKSKLFALLYEKLAK